jgi:hypothetical protein
MLDPIIEVAKHAPMSMSKSEWYQEIFKRSEQQSSPTWSRMALCQATIWTWC